jgi:23S rRNA pseudouridine1911/1915/1917 synthase
MEPKVIYEDENFLAVDKPAGLLVHRTGRSSGARERTLADWLMRRYPEIRDVGDDPAARPGIVHRLDKGASGVLLVARNRKYFDYLKALFKSREMDKTYLAVVFGAPREKSGEISGMIGIKSGSIKRSVRSAKDAKPALTAYKVIKVFERDGEKFSLLQVKPKTGRTHQIRVHLASIGNPIVGDPLYGRKKQPAWAARLMLHALALEFNLPGGKRMRLETDPPEEFVCQ